MNGKFAARRKASLSPKDFIEPKPPLDFESTLKEGMKNLCDSLPKPDEQISFEDDLFMTGQEKGGPTVDLHTHVSLKVGRAMDKFLKANIYPSWDNRGDIVRSALALLFLTIFRRNGSPKVQTILGGIIEEREVIRRQAEENGLAENLIAAEKEAENAAVEYNAEEARDFLQRVIATATRSLPDGRRKEVHLAKLNDLLQRWVKKCSPK